MFWGHMTTWGGVHLLAASSALIVVALALTQSARNPLRRPLALIGTVQFAWNAVALGSELAALPAYAMVGAIAAPFYPPLALDFVLTFLGKRKQYRWPLRVTMGVFAVRARWR